MEKKKVIILGSTGSIGRQALSVIESTDAFEVVGLAALSSLDLLIEQNKQFHPKKIAIFDEIVVQKAKTLLPVNKILSGREGLLELVHEKADIVIAAMTGMEALAPIAKAIELKKDIAIANKELLVAAGEYIMLLAKKYKVNILPIDSEHSAIFQLLDHQDRSQLEKIIITASGGPFRDYSEDRLSSITLKEALKHPTWQMGVKNTIDSSTLMNKGLEVIEAKWLFGLDIDQIDVVVHPQSIIHSMVEWKDHSYYAQLSNPSMELPIAFALHYPSRYATANIKPLDFSQFLQLQFYPPDKRKFKCLDLAYDALKIGKSMPCFMNAVNEELVKRFVNHDISWLQISALLEKLMKKHRPEQIKYIDDVLAIDHEARKLAQSVNG
ncbi:MAG: 1-deoxy-D-xylulose-5-phosphate reductoisomerase [Chlamydiales bacterium]|nr:1-deoxy-D-xylulose-5-phosphate reductoisomerase [Chlamydiales bacterium]